MNGRVWLLVFWGLALACARAEDVATVRFYSDPPGARVLLNGLSEALGNADGEPVLVPLTGKPTLVFEFVLEGYRKTELRVEAAELNNLTRLPASGPLVLQPESAMAYLRHFRFTLAALLGLAGASGLGLLLVHRRGAHGRKLEALLADAEPTSLTGTRLGPYRLLDRLGRGGMARVYRALPEAELDSRKAVAIKLMQDELAEDPELHRRFEREVKMCMGLEHPNIVRVLDWGEHERLVYLVMELVEGGTLRQRIPPVGMSVSEVAGLADQLFEAVAYAHSRGVVHRDLKPENIMLTAGGLLKLMDFGLGKKQDSSNLTQSGAILGTPAYMAPEQIQGVGFEPATDQYALGVIIYELLTGHTPFHSDEPVQLLFQHVAEDPPPPGLSTALDAVLLKMLAKRPTDRYVTTEEARHALLGALQG